jgi:hypothetical protein
MRPIDDSW